MSEIVMFAGKGGVGKTTCAATAALHHAASGKSTLAISTDATPSLSHIFEVAGKQRPIQVGDLVYIAELGVEEIKDMWDRKFGREVYEVFASFVSVEYEEFVAFMTSLLPGLGDEFMVDYIRELNREGDYDTIVWDTAPLGQTLALLQTPAMLGEHLKMAPRIYSKLKLGRKSREPILDIIRRWQKLSAANMDFLQTEVDFTMVTIPEALAVAQLDGVFQEMKNYGLEVKQLVVNNLVPTDGSDFLATKARQQQKYLDIIHHRYSGLRIVELPMFAYELKGRDRLQEVEGILFADNRGVA